MIRFECPFCKEKMEVSERKEGKFIECVECGEMVEVKQMEIAAPRPKKRRREQPNPLIGKDHLTLYEYLLYGAFCTFFPCINLIVCVVLAIMWEDKHTKAYQINQLGLIIFMVQSTLSCLFFGVAITYGGSPGGAILCVCTHLVLTGVAIGSVIGVGNMRG
jgi:hypothetical protein